MEIEVNENRIVIFGAGEYAKMVYSFFVLQGYSEKIGCFLVSTYSNNPKVLFGKKVSLVSAYKDNWEDTRLIIAISEKKHSELRKTLRVVDENKSTWITKEIYLGMLKAIADICTRKPLNRNLLMAYSFWGSGYSCNCKYVVENLMKRKSDISIVWIIDGKNEYCFPEGIDAVEEGSPEFYESFFTAGVIISNVNIPLCGYKRKGQYFISMWHGIGPFKKLDWAISQNQTDGYREHLISDWGRVDLMIAGSDFCHKVYKGSFLYDNEIADYGYPRNDLLLDNCDCRDKVAETYGIKKGDKIVLYAPTFRNELKESHDTNRLREIYNIDLKKICTYLEKRFNCSYTVLFRFHHYIYRSMSVAEYEQYGIDVTLYPDMQELLAAADVLITDYSSSIWDFSLMRKPVFLFFNDADEYEEKYQGFYRHPDTYPLPKGHTTEELCSAIESFDDEKYQRDLDGWFAEYGTYDDGHASERVADRIIDVVEHPEKYIKE